MLLLFFQFLQRKLADFLFIPSSACTYLDSYDAICYVLCFHFEEVFSEVFGKIIPKIEFDVNTPIVWDTS